MPLAAGVVFVIQICFIFHVFKTGRPYLWAFVILSAPIIGCVVYYFVEIFPGSREHYSAHKKARSLVRALTPNAELKKRAEELEICGSTENRAALADECLQHQMYEEAAKLYRSCLTGIYAKDPGYRFQLLNALLEGRQYADAQSELATLRTETPDYRVDACALIDARLQAARGDTQAALDSYRALIGRYVGFEARYRYGLLLKEQGHSASAHEIFEEILALARRNKEMPDSERDWVKLTKREIAG